MSLLPATPSRQVLVAMSPGLTVARIPALLMAALAVDAESTE